MTDTFVFGPSRWPYIDRFPICSLIPTYLCRTLSLIFDMFLRTYPAAFARTMCTRSPADTLRNRSWHASPAGLGYQWDRFNTIKTLLFLDHCFQTLIWSKEHLYDTSGARICRYYGMLRNPCFSVSFLHLSDHIALLLLFRTGAHSLFLFSVAVTVCMRSRM